MERLGMLINKLKEQFERNAEPSQMSITLQLIQSEIAEKQARSNMYLGTSKVSVVMPRAVNVTMPQIQETVLVDEPPVVKKVTPREEPAYVNGHKSEESNGRYREYQPKVEEFDPMVEIPTLSQQRLEINDAVASREASLNDKLKQEQTELFEKLKDSPIRDLRKAIGINDRFVFISELFRGDEAMYERSIKTINSFHIYAEAEYWINRECKVKIGWNESNETVKHFYQLVKRRFA